jgi:hypothetical protein
MGYFSSLWDILTLLVYLFTTADMWSSDTSDLVHSRSAISHPHVEFLRIGLSILQDRKRYEDLRQKLRRSRCHLKKPEAEGDLPSHDTNGHLLA